LKEQTFVKFLKSSHTNLIVPTTDMNSSLACLVWQARFFIQNHMIKSFINVAAFLREFRVPPFSKSDTKWYKCRIHGLAWKGLQFLNTCLKGMNSAMVEIYLWCTFVKFKITEIRVGPIFQVVCKSFHHLSVYMQLLSLMKNLWKMLLFFTYLW
jgi:hypothetical protein